MKLNFYFLLVILLLFKAHSQDAETHRVAFLADVHFQDIYGHLEDTSYKGVFNPVSKKYTLLRTMSSQLHSTRIFNENYFALTAALEDIVKRKIKLVALPGDYTDDGQPLHLRGLRGVLNFYAQKHQLQFFITTGNHDPAGPFDLDAGKTDFLGTNGKRQPLYSKASLYDHNPLTDHQVVVTKDLKKLGYKGVMQEMNHFGFFPLDTYLYWETPFSDYSPASYSLKQAESSSLLNNRLYNVSDSIAIPDASYLVEPEEGLWLLAIDGNVYIPSGETFGGTGKGYSNTIIHKPHLFSWIQKVVEMASKYNKKLVAFSHYPAVDFNEDMSSKLKRLLGDGKWQLARVPEEHIAETMANAGLKLHFAGHMHINDTGKRSYSNNRFIFNIQTPSLAAYAPGYKILSLNHTTAEVETIVIDDVPRFRELFPLYQSEHDALKRSNQPAWDLDILTTTSYYDFMEQHLEHLVNLRFINDWPKKFINQLYSLDSDDFLLLAQNHETFKLPQKSNHKNQYAVASEKQDENQGWTGKDLLMDFYKLRNADKLALQDIPCSRLQQYKHILQGFQKQNMPDEEENKFKYQLHLFMRIFSGFLNGLPSIHFEIDLQTGEILDLVED